jgi:glucose 1-dehydrogenase
MDNAIAFDSRVPLKGQKALITGASSGIGEAVARCFAAAGAAVGVNYRSGAAAARKIIEEVRAAGAEAIPLEADVASEREVQAMFRTFLDAFGRIDILVANSGIQMDAPASEMTLEQWRRVIDVNLTGQFLCAREAIRCFSEQGASPCSRAAGKIVSMSSVHEVIPWAGHVNYAASKGGAMLMMKSLAQEVADKRIRVNAIAPGAIRTPINRAAWETPEAESKLLRLIPYGRIGEPEDVAEAALWLASDQSDYVIGATIFVDGGMTLYPAFREGG